MSGKSDEAKEARTRYLADVGYIARRLRGLADDVERLGQPKQDLKTMEHLCAPAAAEIVHALVWGFANLGLDGTVRDAAAADAAALEAQGVES